MLKGRTPRQIALAAALVYAVLGAAWIAGSDEAAALIAASPDQLTRLQSIKGWAYVGITAILAYGLVRGLLWRDARLRHQAARLSATLDSVPTGIALLDAEGGCRQANLALHGLLGAAEDTLHRADLRARIGVDAERWLAAFSVPQRLRLPGPGGRERVLRLSISAIGGQMAEDVDACAAILTLQDVTAEGREQERARVAAVAFESRQPTLITDAAGSILRANRAYLALSGFSLEEVLGRDPRIFGSGHQDARFYKQMWEALTRDGYWEGELINRRRDGSVFPQWESITAVRDPDGRTTHYVAHAIDLSERREIERTLHELENYDRLTGLGNRNFLLQQLGETETQGAGVSLLLLDIDRFRAINDALGLARGDALLREVAGLLGDVQQRPEWRARISADVFGLLCRDPEPCIARLREGLTRLPTVQDTGSPLTACYGSCALGAGEIDPPALLARAETALHHAKGGGPNAYRAFEPDMQSAAEARLALAAQLRRALQRGWIVPYLQIQVNREDRAIGAEALARWERPDGSLVPPAQFIPLAEELGLAAQIGERMLREVARISARLAEAGKPLRLAVNLSAQHLRESDFVERTVQIVREAGAQPGQLTLEVTESLLVEDFGTAAARLDALRDLGFRIAIDDFGTGYSSLSYLRQLPIDELKIDGSFLRDAMADRRGELLFESVVAIGHTLGMAVVAEGVETDAQAALARRCGEVFLQGWLYGRAESEPALLRRLGVGEASRRWRRE